MRTMKLLDDEEATDSSNNSKLKVSYRTPKETVAHAQALVLKRP